MKKLITSLLFLTVFAAPAAYAQTTSTSSIESLIQTLQQQIIALTAQIDAMKKAQSQVAEAEQDVRGTLKLLRTLKEGMTGDDISALQAILAADPLVYPEGRITGYFGPLTAKAVLRFQKNHREEGEDDDDDNGGEVNEKLLRKLNKELEKHPLAHEDSKKGKRPCAIVPPGHMIAKGWLKKDGNVKPIVPPCQILSEGIRKKLGMGSTTPQAPTLSLSASPSSIVSGLSSVVTWSSSKVSSCTASGGWTGTTSTSGTQTVTPTVTTTYTLVCAGEKGSVMQSAAVTVTPFADTTAPVISAVVAANTTASTTDVSWTTNEAATGNVLYGTVTPVTIANGTPISSAALVTTHASSLSGLTASTTYYYVVSSTDAAGNTATSAEGMFTTLP